MKQIELSTGKKVGTIQKSGQHHFIERSLLATCMKEGGQNIGGLLSALTIQTIVAIDTVNGEKINLAKGLDDVFDTMSRFTYEEWGELEQEMLPKEAKEKLEEAAKNLQKNSGSEIGSK